MGPLTITTWKWGSKYRVSDVKKLYGGFVRHLKQPFRFIAFSDDYFNIQGVECIFIEREYRHLTFQQGCFARLRMFANDFQEKNKLTGRIVCSDLDTVITGHLDPVFNRSEPFVILQGANSVNPCPYTGALIMLQSGHHSDVWDDFSLEKASSVPFHSFPDDQGWLWHKIPDAAGWKAGENGVYAFCKPGWPSGTELPRDARIVTFNGWRSPRKFRTLDWIQRNWVE